MQHDYPLALDHILRRMRTVVATGEVVTAVPGGERTRATYGEVAARCDRLAGALAGLGVVEADRVGTLQWNTQAHLEAYMAIPCMGAVLHTLNLRLFPEQLAYVINHAEDKVIIVDASIAPLLAKVRDQLKTVEKIIVKGTGDTGGLGDTLDYDTLL